MTVQGIDRTTFEQDWADWRRQHEAVLAGEHGFLAITSLNWLTAEPQHFPDAPGTWRSDADGVTVQVYAAPGYVEFERDGQQFRLTAFNGHSPGSLNILFTDATSGVTTYPANRALQVAGPDPDGAVTLDFNRAVNLPCAYTEFATCPLPPAENHLPIAVEAGEKLPHEYVS